MNQSQIEYWNGPAGQRWVDHQASLDTALQHLGRESLARANVTPGETILDVGTGCGYTALALASRTGPNGAVCGIDISAPMLQLARSRAANISHLHFVEADAAAYRWQQHFDLLYSRFGVMFFEDPTSAFANLRRALRSGGRLSFICWRVPTDNPWYLLPVNLALEAWPEAPLPPLEEGPGPFAFADGDELEQMLDAAGFDRIQIERYDAELVYSEHGLEAAVRFAVAAGPVARMLGSATDAIRHKVERRIRDHLHAHARGDVIAFPASTWIVGAVNP